MREWEKYDPINPNKSGNLSLPDLLPYAKLLNISMREFSEDLSMREFKNKLEEHILKEVHPYRLYESGRKKGQWITYLPDPTKKDKRRQIKRNSYEALCEAVISFYKDQSLNDMTLDELFERWVIFRRDKSRMI